MDILSLACELVAELDGFRQHVFSGTFGHCIEPVFVVMDQQQIFHGMPPMA
jgi:hypothetical protein